MPAPPAILEWGPWEWSRPQGFWWLLLPLTLWWLSRLRPRPRDVFVGTVRLWRALGAAPHARSARFARAPLPPSMWWILGALTLGALAMSGPRRSATPVGRVWSVVVDGSPSMFLPFQSEAGGPAHESGGPTRLERALKRARAVLGERLRPADRVRWIRPGRPTLELVSGEGPPADWLSAAEHFEEEPRWAFHDRAGCLWVTDAAQPVRACEARRAGWIAVGGAAVPGAVAATGATRLLWTGRADAALVSAPGSNAPRWVSACVEGAGDELPSGPVVELFRLWANERGLCYRAPADAQGAALVLEFAHPRETDASLTAGRDRWRLHGTATPLSGAERGFVGDAWLLAHPASGEPWPLVAARPGRIRVGWSSTGMPTGDQAAFALQWSRLFESVLLPEPGVVPLAERASAGPPAERPPTAPGMGGVNREEAAAGSAPGLGPEAALAAAAWLTALIGVLLATRR